MGTGGSDQEGESLPAFGGNGVIQEDQIEVTTAEVIDCVSYRPHLGDEVSIRLPD